MLGTAILLGFQWVGIWLQHATHFPLPANVIGLILFTLALFCRLVKLEWVERAAEFWMKHMLLFFTPYVVGTIAFFPLIGKQIVVITVSMAFSTFAVLAVSGKAAAFFAQRGEGKEAGQDGG